MGVPNAWTWAATAWKKKQIVMYTDKVPVPKWMPYDYGECKIVVYDPNKLIIPVTLSALRHLIRKF